MFFDLVCGGDGVRGGASWLAMGGEACDAARCVDPAALVSPLIAAPRDQPEEWGWLRRRWAAVGRSESEIEVVIKPT